MLLLTTLARIRYAQTLPLFVNMLGTSWGQDGFVVQDEGTAPCSVTF